MEIGLLFFLPLIGGFIFVSDFKPFRYWFSREESQRLYYRAAAAGVVFFISALFIHFASAYLLSEYDVFLKDICKEHLNALFEQPDKPLSTKAIEIREQIVIACVYALFIGLLTPIWNIFLWLLDKFISALTMGWKLLLYMELQAISDRLEYFIYHQSTIGGLVQVTLTNSKVYVGNVVKLKNADQTLKSFGILLLMSGYRNSADGTVTHNTFYDESLKENFSTIDFLIVIPINTVVTIGPFDLGAYDKFSAEKNALPATPIQRTEIFGNVTVDLGERTKEMLSA